MDPEQFRLMLDRQDLLDLQLALSVQLRGKAKLVINKILRKLGYTELQAYFLQHTQHQIGGEEMRQLAAIAEHNTRVKRENMVDQLFYDIDRGLSPWFAVDQMVETLETMYWEARVLKNYVDAKHQRAMGELAGEHVPKDEEPEAQTNAEPSNQD